MERQHNAVAAACARVYGDVGAAAAQAASAVAGLRAVTVRGRWTGRSLILDVHGQVEADLSVGEADRLGTAVESAVHEAVDDARSVRWGASAAIYRPTYMTAVGGDLGGVAAMSAWLGSWPRSAPPGGGS